MTTAADFRRIALTFEGAEERAHMGAARRAVQPGRGLVTRVRGAEEIDSLRFLSCVFR